MSPNSNNKLSFNGSNYFQFKDDMVVELLVAECKEAIDEDLLQGKTVPNNKKMNNKALGILLQHMESHIRIAYQEETSAFTLWNTLKQDYGSNKRDIMEKLEEEYNSIKYSSFEETITNFTRLVAAMKQCGINRDEELVCLKLIKILPEAWKSFTTAIRIQDNLTLKYLIPKLHVEYQTNTALHKTQQEKAIIVTHLVLKHPRNRMHDFLFSP